MKNIRYFKYIKNSGEWTIYEVRQDNTWRSCQSYDKKWSKYHDVGHWTEQDSILCQELSEKEVFIALL